MKQSQPFLIRSWVGMPRDCETRRWILFYFPVTETTLVYHSPRRPLPSEYPPSRVHFARENGHCPLHVDQP